MLQLNVSCAAAKTWFRQTKKHKDKWASLSAGPWESWGCSKSVTVWPAPEGLLPGEVAGSGDCGVPLPTQGMVKLVNTGHR